MNNGDQTGIQALIQLLRSGIQNGIHFSFTLATAWFLTLYPSYAQAFKYEQEKLTEI
jgi:hypothetical protein